MSAEDAILAAVGLMRLTYTVTPEPDVEPEQPTPGEWTQPPRRLR